MQRLWGVLCCCLGRRGACRRLLLLLCLLLPLSCDCTRQEKERRRAPVGWGVGGWVGGWVGRCVLRAVAMVLQRPMPHRMFFFVAACQGFMYHASHPWVSPTRRLAAWLATALDRKKSRRVWVLSLSPSDPPPPPKHHYSLIPPPHSHHHHHKRADMADESKPKLIYFDIKGRGEPIRLAFAGTYLHTHPPTHPNPPPNPHPNLTLPPTHLPLQWAVSPLTTCVSRGPSSPRPRRAGLTLLVSSP